MYDRGHKSFVSIGDKLMTFSFSQPLLFIEFMFLPGYVKQYIDGCYSGFKKCYEGKGGIMVWQVLNTDAQ